MDMQSLSPEEMQVLMELITQGQQAGAEQENIKRQYAQADAMRGKAPAMRDTGRMTVAPSWMELLGGLAGEAASTKLGQKAEKRQRDLGASTAEQNRKLLEVLMKTMQSNQPQAVPPIQPGMPAGMNPAAPNGVGLKMPQNGMPQGPGLQANNGMVPPFQM